MSNLSDSFTDIDEWVFDLDNTLYPRHCDLFAQIDWKMTDYVAELLNLDKTAARRLQKDLYRAHGTTLRGLMVDYDVDPHDFLNNVHDIDYSPVQPNPRLGELLAALPGRKHIFTNGDVAHARRTTDRLGITGHFDGVFDIVASDLVPKPAEEPYRTFLSTHDINPKRAAMFEDMPRNLDVPKKLGMRTILIAPARGSQISAESWEHDIASQATIDHQTDDLDGFLNTLIAALQ